MKKQVTGLMLTVMMLAVLCFPVSAQEAPRVLLDGRALTFDVPPTIENGRVLVPMGAIFNAMGAVVSWDAATSTATAIKNGVTVILPIGADYATINGNAKTLDVPAQIVNGRTLVPLSFIAQALGGSVSWDPETTTVSIVSGLPSPITYEIYSNTKIGYSAPYPNIYDASLESDSGDGIAMETADKLYTLKIWGAYNLNNSTGQDLLNEALQRVSNITSQYAEPDFYSIEYQGGGNGQELTFSENVWVAEDKIVGFVISYPSQQKEQFDKIIIAMAAGM
ncbi:MAG: copper amine oxidase N-terminal domain-containing protein [Syntrophomonas sp.]